MSKKKSFMESYWEDIATLTEMKTDREITIPVSLAQDICDYCESNAIYDKLANYGDFYYKLKKLIEE